MNELGKFGFLKNKYFWTGAGVIAGGTGLIGYGVYKVVKLCIKKFGKKPEEKKDEVDLKKEG